MSAILRGEEADAARRCALTILRRLADRDIDAAANAANESLGFEGRHRAGLSRGYAGLAISFALGYAVTSDPRWKNESVAFLKRAIETRDAELGLMTGRAGIFLTATVCAEIFGGLRGARAALKTELESDIARPRAFELPAPFDWDLVAGPAGVILAVDGTAIDVSAARRTLRERISQRLSGTEDGLDLGMAHGLAGVAVAMVGGGSAANRGSVAADLYAALLRYRSFQEDGALRWPNAAGTTTDRGAWCYGTPGTASAAIAIADSLGLHEDADAMRRELGFALNRLCERRDVRDYGLCHGLSGLLLIAARTAPEGNSAAAVLTSRLARRIIEGFDETFVFGYRAVGENDAADEPGFLQGAAGIASALLFVASDVPVTWLRALGLSGRGIGTATPVSR